MGESTSTTLEDRDIERAVPPGDEAESGAILFPELVWAHYRWQNQLGLLPSSGRNAGVREPGTSPAAGNAGSHDSRKAEAAYRAKLKEFQAVEGKILDVYWCWNEASAVALTAKQTRRSPFSSRVAELRLHRATDWATIKLPEVAELLHHYDALAIKASEVLAPTPRRITMEWIFAEQSYLLGFVETMKTASGGSRLGTLLSRQRGALKRIEDYYARAAEKAARVHYFLGMLLGTLILAVLAAAVAVPLILLGDVDPIETRDYLSSYAAGALGALVSVMSRMGQDTAAQQGFRLDYEVGKARTYFLGMVRPALGAVFGTATYFALQSSLVQMSPTAPEEAFYFFALLAFLSGFSERFAHVILGEAQRTVTATLSEEEEREAKEPSADRSRKDKDAEVVEETTRRTYKPSKDD